MANRNRNAGNGYERKIVKELKELGFDVGTSRNESRKMDAMKVDIVGNVPFHIQCKNTTTKPDYCSIINDMPKDKPPIIFNKLTEKHGDRFMPKGEFVILRKDDFYRLIVRE